MNSGQIVSIIVTTKNEEKVIGRLLASIKKQSYKNFEIILVDNSSTDQTVRIAKKSNVKIVNFGPERSAQRNYGAKIARGNYLLFVDADMQISRNVIKECIKVVSGNKNIGAVVIPEVSEARNFWEKVKGFERSFYNEQGDPVTDAARFFLKKAFIQGGGYDEDITGPEDWDLPETIKEKGYLIERVSARIRHRERISSPIALAKKKFYYGQHAYKYFKKHKIPILGSKTIYFLRPIFYRNSFKIIRHPILSAGMILMLSVEMLGGGLGYLVGRIRKL